MTDDVKLPNPDFSAFNGPHYYTEATVRRLIAEAVDRKMEKLRGGNDLDAMSEAFRRLIESHVGRTHPFHQPVCADAELALRVLRWIVANINAGGKA